MFLGGAGAKLMGGMFRGIANKIRERRIRKHKRLIMPNIDFGNRGDRLKVQAILKNENAVLKYDNGKLSGYTKPTYGEVAVSPASSYSGMIAAVKGFDWGYLLKFLPLLLIPVAILKFPYGKKKSKVRRRRKVRKAATAKAKAVKRSSTGKPVMPIKYRSGCKGKKGTELGRCLQYWRKYRKGEIKKQ